MTKRHIEPAKKIARAKMMVDSVLDFWVVMLFQPAGSTDVSKLLVEGVDVGTEV